MPKVLPRLTTKSIFPIVLSVLAGFVYAIMAWGHAHGQVSVIDEGLYLYKGYLFTVGGYRPFQDFGPLTNHMPLSFLIPGWIQMVFGIGIRVGRYYSVFLGLLMLLGLWLVTRRLAGKWWGVMALWAIVLNPGQLKMYSQATSQILVACMLIWILYFVVGKDRSIYQLVMGAILSGLLFMTRINMAPVLVLVLIYVFWARGRRTGLIIAAVGLSLVAIGHAFFWPEILKIWAKWLPTSMTPYLESFRLPSNVVPFWDPNVDIYPRIGSFKTGIRLHLLSIVGFVGLGVILIGNRRSLGSRSYQGVAWFLSCLFGVLFLFHGGASLGLNYCVYCFRNYVAFFSPVGLIMLAMWGKAIGQSGKRFKAAILIGLFVVMLLVIGPISISELTDQILLTHVPRVTGLSLDPGTVELHVLLGNKLDVEIEDLRMAGELVLTLLVILIPVVTLALGFLQKRRKHSGHPSAILLHGMTAFLILQMSISSITLGNSFQDYDCGKDVILANENVGSYLTNIIPEKSVVYWGVGRAPIPLLYLQNRSTFPPQLNGDYTYMLEGDTQELLRYGYWDQSAAKSWLESADYVLTEVRNYPSMIKLGFEEEKYDEILRTSPTNPCNMDSSIMIFKNQ